MSVRPDWSGGVIAAGQGQRLRDGGWQGSKAMVPVAGRPLIDHALDRFAAGEVHHVTVLINDAGSDCQEHLAHRRRAPDVELVVRTTPSSFASFALMADMLGEGSAVVSTVDAIMPADAFAGFLDAIAQLPVEALVLGVTRHVDDEAPLWVELGRDQRVMALGGLKGTHVTAGLYAWRQPLPRPADAGFARLRDYLGWIVAGGRPVFGVELPKVFDVDRPGDVAEAERALDAWTSAGAGA